MTPDEIAALERRISKGLACDHDDIRWSTDERANAQLLEMLAEACGPGRFILSRSRWPAAHNEWIADVRGRNGLVFAGPGHPDRRIAICLAAEIWLKERVR